MSYEPALYVACKRHDVAMVELLLAHGASPDAEYEKRASGYFESEPCLHAAVASADYVGQWVRPTTEPVEIARMLLEKGANLNVPYRDRDDCYREMSVLGSARGNPDLVALLERYGARE
ncbi:MAG TPA: hypothetical protein VF746_30060 [Longimicrobium sp.]